MLDGSILQRYGLQSPAYLKKTPSSDKGCAEIWPHIKDEMATYRRTLTVELWLRYIGEYFNFPSGKFAGVKFFARHCYTCD